MEAVANNYQEADQEVFNEDLANFVNREYDRRQNERNPFELQWRLNTEFIKGNQFLTINTNMRKLDEVPKLYWWQEREVFNQISTIVETRIARLTRQQPQMKARPASAEEGDYQSAKVSSAILESKWYDESMTNKYNDLVTWLEHTGTVFIKNTWNSDRGRKVATVQVPEVVEDEGFEVPKTREVEIREGDIESNIVSPFEIYPDSISRNTVEECKSIIHAKAFHVNDVLDLYGVEVDSEKVDGFGMQSGNGLSGATYGTGGYKTANQKLKNHVVVKEYYEKPSSKHPNGRLIIVAKDQVLHNGELPYKVGSDKEPSFPFTRIPCVPIPNCFWGQSVAERCIPVQRRYNALRNRKAEYLNLVAIGQWYEPKGSLDDDTELNNSPGNRIRYNPGAGAPQPVQFPSLPSSFETEEQSLLSEFTAISGVSELARFSQAPSGVKSGVALSITNEQDDTRISMTANRIAEAIRQTGQHWLRLYQQYVQEPRIVRTVGQNVDVFEWTASDLKSDDVIIQNTAALSETPAQRRQMVFDLINTGLFNREENNAFGRENAQKILELIEMGHWEVGTEGTFELHKKRAERENQQLKHGTAMPQIKPYDDHQVHIDEHNQFRLRPEYEELIATPQGQAIAQILDQHVAMHQQALQQQQAQQMQQQLAMQQAQQGTAPPQ